MQFDTGSEIVNESAGTFSIPVTVSGTPTVSTFASGFDQPYSLAVDSAGNLYVPNGLDDNVSKVTPAGVVSTFASGFDSAIGVAFDAPATSTSATSNNARERGYARRCGHHPRLRVRRAVRRGPRRRQPLRRQHQCRHRGRSEPGVPIDGADNGMSGTNYVMAFSGAILAGPAPTLLRTDPTRFALEQKKMAAVDKRAAAVPHESAKLRKSLTAAEKKMAAVTQKLAVKPTRNGSSTASAVDDVLGSGTVSVKRIVAKRRNPPDARLP